MMCVREAIAEFEKLRAEQNTLSKSVGAAKWRVKRKSLLESAKKLATSVKAADAKRADAEVDAQ